MRQRDSASMTPEEWSRIEAIFHDALERPVADRVAFLDRACRGDSVLRQHVESLIRHAADNQTSLIAFPFEELVAGQTIGHYKIVSVAGAGGMGKVYRARDTKLGRDVAVKVLRDEFSKDAERVRRSEREAKLLASLNHPNIAAIYDLEEPDGIPCLVLEFVEGESLADRLSKGRIPIAESLDISRQIADALDAAHEQGIVHRDLKPANVMITPKGVVKVLDFGIGKLLEPTRSPDSTAGSDSITAGRTIGTPSYMSPEQARGKPIDKRTDIWAFGCVLFELLTGRRAFEGETTTDTLAAVVEREPD
jgi:serine/threonine protein kinase